MHRCLIHYIHGILYIVIYGAIAGQRLGKNLPAVANASKNRTYIARQRISKHA
jgi:hypothetical protein